MGCSWAQSSAPEIQPEVEELRGDVPGLDRVGGAAAGAGGTTPQPHHSHDLLHSTGRADHHLKLHQEQSEQVAVYQHPLLLSPWHHQRQGGVGSDCLVLSPTRRRSKAWPRQELQLEVPGGVGQRVDGHSDPD